MYRLWLNHIYQENCNAAFNKQEIYRTLTLTKQQSHVLRIEGARFEVVMVITMKMTVIWNVMLCRLVGLPSFGVTCCFHLQGNSTVF
jgi:hypothetical protein